MSRFARLWIALAWVVAVSVSPSGAGADEAGAESSARAEAMRKYAEGSKAFEQRRFKDAIDLFLEADAYAPSPALAYNTSVAYEAMGDAASALKWSREYLRRAPAAEDRPQVQAIIDKLEARLREKGIQQVTVLSTPPGATVSIDDRPTGVTPWTGELRPGSHRVDLRLAGHRAANRSFELRPERSLEVTLTLEEEQPTAASVPAGRASSVPGTDRAEETSSNALTISGIVTLGVGVAGLGAAIGLEVARAGAEQDVRDAELQVDAADKLSTMEDLQLGARIALGVGGGLALAGGAMLVAGLVTREPESAPQVSLGCSDTGCAFMVRGWF